MIVWLASYPRSGNTFFRTILKSIFGYSTYSVYNDVHDIEKNPLLKNVTGHEILQPGDIPRFRESEQIYFIKTHNLPVADYLRDKIIYLVRDGRGSTISFRNYLQKFSPVPTHMTFTELVNGNHAFGSWNAHVRAWRAIDGRNRLQIRFEDIISDATESIQQVEDFLGITRISDHVHTFEHLNNIDQKFFRKGQANSWKTELTEIEHAYFWTQSYKEMIQLGYCDDMPSYYTDPNILNVLELISENKVSILEEKIAVNKQNTAALEKNFREVTQNLAAATKQTDLLTQKNSSLTKENSDLALKYASNVNELKSVSDQNALLKNETNQLAIERNQLKEALNIVIEKLNELKEKQQSAISESERIQANSTQIEAEFLSLQEQYMAHQQNANDELRRALETTQVALQDNAFYKRYADTFFRSIGHIEALMREYRIVTAMLAQHRGEYFENRNVREIELLLGTALQKTIP